MLAVRAIMTEEGNRTRRTRLTRSSYTQTDEKHRVPCAHMSSVLFLKRRAIRPRARRVFAASVCRGTAVARVASREDTADCVGGVVCRDARLRRPTVQASLAVSTRVSGSAVVAPYEKIGRAGQRLTCLFAYSCNRARQTMMMIVIIPGGFPSGDQLPGHVVSFGS